MKHLKPIVYFVTTLSIIAVVNAFAWPPEPVLIKRSLKVNSDYKQRIDNKKPEIVLLGNSMLGEAVDEMTFQRQSGWKTVKINSGGAATAWWYLIIKNQIVKAEYKPGYIVLFFRDQYLTVPDFRVTGKYKGTIDEYASDKEPVLDRLAYLNNMTELEYLMKRYWPLYQRRDHIMDRFENRVKSIVASTVMQENSSVMEVNEAIERVFDDENLNQELLTIQQIMAETMSSSHEFQKSVDRSFLPYILKIADENDIQMIFVRMKRRRDLDQEEPVKVARYFDEMRPYLESHGAILIDFTNDERIEERHYGAGDHLNREEGRKLFTKILIEELQKHIDTGS